MLAALFMAVCVLAWLLSASPHAGHGAATGPAFSAMGNLVASGGDRSPSEELHHHLVRKKLRRTELKPEAAAFAPRVASMRPPACLDTHTPVAAVRTGSDIRSAFVAYSIGGPRRPTAPQLRLRPGQSPPVV